MIAIVVNNRSLDLPPNIKIKIKGVSPFFYFNKMAGEATLPFNIDATPNNLEILNYPNELLNSGDLTQEYPASIFLDSSEYRSGTLAIKKVTNTSIRLVFKAGLSSIRNKLKNTLLTELELGGAFEIPEGRPYIEIKAKNVDINHVDSENDLEIQYIDTDYGDKYTAGDPVYHTVTITNPHDHTNPDGWRNALSEMVADINENEDLPIYAEVITHPFAINQDRIKIYHRYHNSCSPESPDLDDEFYTDTFYFFGGGFELEDSLLAQDHDIFTRTTWPLTTHAENTITDDDANYVFPMYYNKNLFPERASTVSGFVNAYYSDDYGNPDNSGPQYFTPMFKVKFVLECIFSENGYTLIGNEIESDFFKKLIVFNTALLDINNFQYLNRYAGTLDPPIFIYPNMHMPVVSCEDFILGITKYLGYTFVFNTVAKTVEMFKLAEAPNLTKVLNLTTKSSPSYTITPIANKEGVHISLSKAKNDAEAAAQFINWNDYSVKVVVDDYADLPTSTDNINTDDIAFVRNENYFYRATNTPPVTWAFEGELVSQYREGKEEFSVVSNFQPIAVYAKDFNEGAYGNGDTYIIPIVEEGATAFFNYGDRDGSQIGQQPIDLRLLIWHGLQENSAGDDYPFASTTDTDYTGSVIEDQTLYLSGNKGLYEKAWKEYVELLNNIKPVEFEALFNQLELLTFDFSYHLYSFNARLMPVEYTTELTNNEASVVSLKAYKV